MGRWTPLRAGRCRQIHLAVDVANAPLDMEQADRFVSRSRSQVVYQAAKSELEQLMRTLRGNEDDELDVLTMDWDSLYEDDATTPSTPSTSWCPSVIGTSSQYQWSSAR